MVVFSSLDYLRRVVSVVLVGGLLFGAETRARAADQPSRTVIGKLVSPTCSLLRRIAPNKPWEVVAQYADVYSEDHLLGAPNAVIDLKTGARLILMADLEARSRFPVIESVAIVHEHPGTDLSFTLLRGRASVSNQKKEGKASVEVRFVNQKWNLELYKMGDRFALELFGRWPKGTIFSTEPSPDAGPIFDMVLIVIKGEIGLHTGDYRYLLKEPPGEAVIGWDSNAGRDARPSRLEKRPGWAMPLDSTAPEVHQRLVRLNKFRNLVQKKSLVEALTELLHSSDPQERRFAVYGLAATDHLEPIGDAVMSTKNEDVWDNAVLALRHWMGRAPGQDQKLYHFLVEQRNHTPAHAAIIVQLFFSFSDRDLETPACYEMLIEYLKHEKQAIRGLAQWHLRRLVPAGKSIKVNPTAPRGDWDKAYKEWKKLIPDGKLPPAVDAKP